MSKRELEVLQKVEDGDSVSEVADDLGIGTDELEIELKRIFEKIATSEDPGGGPRR